jgi:hypothetical protein
MNRLSGTIIGILAGIASGLMAIAALRAGTAALAMMFAAPIPVYLASLGWGTAAGFVAAALAAASGMIIGGVKSIVVTAALMFLPAAWVGHLANLGQRGADGTLIWFPLEKVFFHLAVAVIAGILVMGFVLRYDTAALQQMMLDMMKELASSGRQSPAVTEEGMARSARLYAALIPFLVPMIWLIIHVVIFYLAALIARRSGRLARPRDDIPATANLPFAATGIPLAGIVGMIFSTSPFYEIGAVMAGVGTGAFALVGLAELHLRSMGRPGRNLMLFATYLLLFLFTLPIVILAIMGILRSWRRRMPPMPPATTGGNGH